MTKIKEYIDIVGFDGDYGFEWYNFLFSNWEPMLQEDDEVYELETLLFKAYDKHADDEFFLED